MNKSLDEILEEHVELWLNWVENDKKSRDEASSYAERRKAAQMCEALVNKKYLLIGEIDVYFENQLKRS
jgi:hypothetical protein